MQHLFTKVINSNWAEVVHEVNMAPQSILKIYRLLKKELKKSTIDEAILSLAACFLENNNILFYSYASYKFYQEISALLFKQLLKLKTIKKQEPFYRFCFVGVYTDYFHARPKQQKIYTRYLADGLEYFRKKYKKQNTRQELTNYFLSLIHISQHYLFQGALDKSHLFLQQALLLLLRDRKVNINHKLFFYYHFSWSFFEKGDYANALKFANKLLTLKRSDTPKPIILHAMNIKCAMLFALKQHKRCFILAKKVARQTNKVFSIHNQDVYAESLLNIAKCLTYIGTGFAQAITLARKAIVILGRLFLGQDIDPSQALANIVLAEAYACAGNKEKALCYFKIAKTIYKKIYRTKAKSQDVYLQLMAKINAIEKHQTLP